ncbi:MAG TPA: hypothetical protein VI932_11955, partial [Bacteroidota bacterium]|nr:hypothetical protein [Bacteroidota bacterium]
MTRRTGNFIAFLLLACWPAATAQLLTWNDISGPPGFERLYELGDGTLYATDQDVLYRSFDGGVTWENFPRPGGPILEFAARGSVTVLAIQRNFVNYKQYFLSADRGNSWTRIYTEANPVHTNLMLSADGTPYALYPAGSKFAVERFVNGLWERMGVPSGVFSVAPPRLWTVSDLDDSGTFYIGSTADGIHSSRDNGRTWTKALPYRYVSSIAFAPGGRVAIATTPNGRTVGGVFVSDDRGATWNLAGLTDVYILGFKFNAAGDLLVLGNWTIGTAAGIYRLDAGAADWDSTEPFDFDYNTLHVTAAGK